MGRIIMLAGLTTLLACAPATRGQAQATPDSPGDLPAGYGTLSQDDIALNLRQEELEIRAIPLDEQAIRLLAPDAYRSMHELVRSHRDEIDSLARQAGVANPGLLLVSYFGRRSGARFDPQNLSLIIRNQYYRPIGVIPFSPNFGGHQLDVRERALGVFLYEEQIPVFEVFSIANGITSSASWEGKISRLQRERARIQGKIKQENGG
ncbi:MAG: hypothetical protein AB7I33_17085 [Gemmatimonadales bacterium]